MRAPLLNPHAERHTYAHALWDSCRTVFAEDIIGAAKADVTDAYSKFERHLKEMTKLGGRFQLGMRPSEVLTPRQADMATAAQPMVRARRAARVRILFVLTRCGVATTL